MRATARRSGKALVDPHALATNLAYSSFLQAWRQFDPQGKSYVGHYHVKIFLDRVIYYDARPDDEVAPLLEGYWKTIELLHDTEIGFGAVRGRPRRQKRVDGLIAVDMLEGAFNNLYQVALLVAADADFVPIVQAVRRRGVLVAVVASDVGLSDELLRAADRFRKLNTDVASEFPPLRSAPDGKVW